MEIIVLFTVLIFSVVIHEVMHGYTALLLGDTTAKRSGRLTFNPLHHINLWTTIIIPVLFYLAGFPVIGMAKPVPVNPYNFYNRKKGTALVSLSGPLSNFSLAVAASLIYHLLIFMNFPMFLLFKVIFIYIIYINIVLGFFNLIPIPPLDGSKLLLYFVPPEYEKKIIKITPYGIFIIIFLIYFNIINLGSFIKPIFEFLIGTNI